MFNVFRHNYGKDSDSELLNNFRSENWSNLNDGDKIRICQEVENRNAEEQGREACKVESSDNEGQFGCFYPSSNKIEINLSDVGGQNSSYNVLDTVYHEGEHAYQQHCLDNDVEGLPKETLRMCDLENQPCVYSEQIGYDNCSCEIDSNNFAVDKLTEHKDLFMDDPSYGEYIETRLDEYQNVNENRDDVGRKQEQLNAVEFSHNMNNITDEQKDEMLSTINVPANEEPVIAEAKAIETKLQQTSQEIQSNKMEANNMASPRDMLKSMRQERASEQSNENSAESSSNSAMAGMSPKDQLNEMGHEFGTQQTEGKPTDNVDDRSSVVDMLNNNQQNEVESGHENGSENEQENQNEFENETENGSENEFDNESEFDNNSETGEENEFDNENENDDY